MWYNILADFADFADFAKLVNLLSLFISCCHSILGNKNVFGQQIDNKYR